MSLPAAFELNARALSTHLLVRAEANSCADEVLDSTRGVAAEAAYERRFAREEEQVRLSKREASRAVVAMEGNQGGESRT